MKSLGWTLSVLAVVSLVTAWIVSVRDLRRRIDRLEAGQEQLHADLESLKVLLTSQQPNNEVFKNAFVSTSEARSLGSLNSVVTIVEFSDYQCPFCGRYAQETYPQVIADYVKTGKVRYIAKNFPLDQIHPLAVKAAEAAECAGEQGKFWEFHDRLLLDQKALDSASLLAQAAALGMDGARFRTCTEQSTFGGRVEADIAEARKLGLEATPSFVVGYSDEQDPSRIKVVKAIIGAQPLTVFTQTLESVLDSRSDSGKGR